MVNLYRFKLPLLITNVFSHLFKLDSQAVGAIYCLNNSFCLLSHYFMPNTDCRRQMCNSWCIQFQNSLVSARAQAIPKVIKQYLLHIILHGIWFNSKRLKKITKNRADFAVHQRALPETRQNETGRERVANVEVERCGCY